jgi:hypothetical protein
MGRSQVARNQRYGRPGAVKGRGGRGSRGDKGKEDKQPKRQNQVPLEGNSFRYENYQETSPQSDSDNDWDHLALGEQYKYVPRTLPSQLQENEHSDQDDEGGHLSLDIHKLSACLDRMESSTWMRLSDDITKRYDERIGGNHRNQNQKMTIAEMTVTPHQQEINGATETEEMGKQDSSVNDAAAQVSSEDTSVNADSDDSDDEDLDAWLDGVIET